MLPETPSVGKTAAVMLLLVLLYLLFKSDYFIVSYDNSSKNVEIVQSHKGKDRIICFLVHESGEAENVIYDYADYTETMLGYTSKILIPDHDLNVHHIDSKRFSQRFINNTITIKTDFVTVLRKMEYRPAHSLPSQARAHGCDFVYTLKSGEDYSFPRYPEAFDFSVVRSGVHSYGMWQHHSAKIPQAGVSSAVTNGVEGRDVVLPIVRPPSKNYSKVQDYRSEWNITSGTFVLCLDSFEPIPPMIPFNFGINKLIANGSLVFGVLGHKWFDAKGIRYGLRSDYHYFEANVVNEEVKERLMKTCNGAIFEKRANLFGIQAADFISRGIPMHVGELQDKEIVKVVTGWVTNGANVTHSKDSFKLHSPEVVMLHFKKVFLDPIFGKLDGLVQV